MDYDIIKKNINRKLKTLKIPILANEIRSGFKKPAFFVQLMPILDDAHNYISENIININIHYFSDEKTEISNLKMLSILRNLFRLNLEIEEYNRVLTLYDKDYEIEDNVLQFKFTLNYTEDTEEKEDVPLMEELYMRGSV